MLTVISVAAVMMGLAVTLIHRLLEAERQALDLARSSAAVSRLASHWREDLHAAVQVELTQTETGQPSRLIATTADGRQIRYELDQHVASRLEDLADGQTHRDMFYFPPRTRLQLSREEENLMRLQIDIPAGGSTAYRKNKPGAEEPFRRLRIEASPSRDRRFARRDT